MRGFDPAHSFGHEVSRTYDTEPRGDEAETIDFLAGIAAGRDVLELAVGTGRVALPLAATGLRVDGIELSQDMVDRMREKPGGTDIQVTLGDMSRVDQGRRYGLVYLVFNTIGNLLTQDDQVRCFENAARHLDDKGVFVLECRVPVAPSRPQHQFVDVVDVTAGNVRLDANVYDPVTQLLDVQHMTIDSDGVHLSPISLRQAAPPEFDLMARIAGLRLRDRWGGWQREPFTADSRRHVSVYERADAATRR